MGRPPKTKSRLAVLLKDGHTLKSIAAATGIPYDTLRSISAGRTLTSGNAEKIADKYPVSVDFLMGLPGLDEYEDAKTVIQKTPRITATAYNEASLAALQEAAKLVRFTLPQDPALLMKICHESVYGAHTKMALRSLSGDRLTATRELSKMDTLWRALPDDKVPKHPPGPNAGRRMTLLQFLSFSRAQRLPQVEVTARPDLMFAVELMLLSAGEHRQSHLIAREVLEFVHATKHKYQLDYMTHPVVQERLKKESETLTQAQESKTRYKTPPL